MSCEEKEMVNDGEWEAEMKLTKVKKSLFLTPLPPTHLCFSPVVVTVSVTNKEVQIKSTIFRMTLCLLV